MQMPPILRGRGFDAKVEADDSHLRLLELEMELFEFLPDDPRLIPHEVFLPFDGT
jgi:hypothetical protein